MKALTLLGRPGCHLCDDMRAALEEFRASFEFSLREVDIDTDPALVARYGRLIPVLTEGHREICHYFLDPTALTRHLTDSTTSG